MTAPDEPIYDQLISETLTDPVKLAAEVKDGIAALVAETAAALTPATQAMPVAKPAVPAT